MFFHLEQNFFSNIQLLSKTSDSGTKFQSLEIVVQQGTSRYHREVNTSSGRDRRKKDTHWCPSKEKGKKSMIHKLVMIQIGGNQNF